MSYPNLKVAALLAGHISIEPSQWTEDDYLALAIAAADQGGASVRTQNRIAALLVVESPSEPEANPKHSTPQEQS